MKGVVGPTLKLEIDAGRGIRGIKMEETWKLTWNFDIGLSGGWVPYFK